MHDRNRIATALIALACVAMLAPTGRLVAHTPETVPKPAEVPTAPDQKPRGNSRDGTSPTRRAEMSQSNDVSAAKKVKGRTARKAAEARIARCRLHPEICVQ